MQSAAVDGRPADATVIESRLPVKPSASLLQTHTLRSAAVTQRTDQINSNSRQIEQSTAGLIDRERDIESPRSSRNKKIIVQSH